MLLGALALPAGGAGQDGHGPTLVPCEAGTCVAVRLPEEAASALAREESAEPSEDDWREVLPVRTAASAGSDPPGPTLFGDYAVEQGGDGARLVFRPRLPLLPGTPYVALFRPGALDRVLGTGGGGAAAVELRFEVEAEPREAPRVVAIEPAVEEVPANLLRAYVHFSVPMRPDVAPRYVRLLDEEGREVELAFVELAGGLWDRRSTRLTLLFHPGRLKQGVAPHEALGPPLEAGRRYRLVIGAGWPSATGERLAGEAAREWRVTAADRGRVEPGGWSIETPAAGTTVPLRVRFGEPLDPALALRTLAVARGGERMEGTPELLEGATGWSFRPAAPWSPDGHVLRVPTALEDLAGNTIRGAFDRPAGEAEGEARPVEIPFRPR
jgi:hypothetical protein